MEPVDNKPVQKAPVTNEDLNVGEYTDETRSVAPGQPPPDVKAGSFNFTGVAASGTRLFGEIFDEEYLQKLTGTHRADIYDEMLRSDDTITMLMTARKNPIQQANWEVEPAKGDTPEEEALNKKIADHVHHEFFDRMSMDFMEFIEEALTFVEHGYSLFERIHQIVEDKKFGKYIGYKKLGWRSQRTIERWKCANDGTIESVYQQAYSDVGKNVQIPGAWVTIFTLRKTGDNYEGISALRSIYGNWQRKNIFLKLIAIGIERYAINTPVGTIPAGKENSTQERDRFTNMLKAISSHHQNYFMLPDGWKVDFLKNPFDADKIVGVIKREDEGMVRSFMANHLNLGQGGSGGAYALGTDLSDQFLSIIENDAAIITRRFNKAVIKEFVDMNYGAQSKYPKLKVTGINDKFSKEFAEIIKLLTDSKQLTATGNNETWLRKRLGLPPLLEADAASIPEVRKQEKAALFNEQKWAEDKSKVESLIFKKTAYTKDQAIQWAKDHGFTADKVDETGDSFRIRQLPPDSFKTLRTKPFNKDISSVIGFADGETIPTDLLPEPEEVETPCPSDDIEPGEVQLAGKATFADLRKTKSKVVDQITVSGQLVAQAMKDELMARAEDFTTKLINAMKKEKRENWRKVIRNAGDLRQEGDFVKKVKQALIECAGRALAQARNEVPGGRKIVFMEGVRSRISLADTDKAFAALPKKTQEQILTDPAIVSGSQFGTLRTRILLTASNGVDETGDPDIIAKNIADETSKALEGDAASEISGAISTAANNLTAKVYNSTRIEFFQSDEALDKIEAFMFVNPDPVSPICQDLNGRVFEKDDPSADEYLPPLHHNCKSFIVPLFSLQGKTISPTGLQPSDPKLDKFKTL